MSMNKLNPKDHLTAAYIFQALTEFQPLAAAVIHGLQPGSIYVDDLDSPQAGLINVWGNWCFLAGEPHEGFITDLNAALFDRSVIDSEAPFLLFTIDEAVWGEHLAAVFHPRHPIPMLRRHYTAKRITYDWRASIPNGYQITPMSLELLERPELPDEVRETLERWQSSTHPDFRDCGFVAVYDEKIAAWATVDGVTNGAGDVGLVTQETHRRKGLAAATSAAAMEQALANGTKVLHWTCAENNLGSIRTAEKLGLTLQRSYRLFFFEYDELWDLIQYAGHLINAGEHQHGLELCTRALGISSDPPQPLLIYTARAQAVLGMQDEALTTLRQLVKAGWKDAAFLENDPRFETLHDSAGWQAILTNLHEETEITPA